ncbi:predicted protein [Streptomyces sp. SPB78]|nr:predicted protein [Streptomyces sp. SPB78]
MAGVRTGRGPGGAFWDAAPAGAGRKGVRWAARERCPLGRVNGSRAR